VNDDSTTTELRLHLQRTLGLDATTSARVLDEVLNYFNETPEMYVCRRHQELQHEMVPNAKAFGQIQHELRATRFRAVELSERQIRRLIYG
jgi:hypothetical protein